ncbi:hypothetical protein [Pseudogemmobacter faecipullorum]|uniref:Uncharacterized protein n=1 Tax=Pseudogemmobacter faecipullorum TaxID=2755041 RepID=A0ABS8CPF8_9RHOB|nr:hypothetical protein [Pseudogemmobacter faecipullorum]MCB5411254.1 hypothetical protein [Pseudogemmobacter faecipullorum]
MSSEIGQQDQEGQGLAALWPAGLMLCAGLAGLALATIFSDGVPGQYVVIAPPFGPPALEIISQAEGAIVAAGGFDNVLIAASERPDFADELRRAGALIVFPAPAFLGCSPPPEAGA